jgi:hypothetical protein
MQLKLGKNLTRNDEIIVFQKINGRQ